MRTNISIFYEPVVDAEDVGGYSPVPVEGPCVVWVKYFTMVNGFRDADGILTSAVNMMNDEHFVLFLLIL